VKFEEKFEAPRYRKWLKIIEVQIERKKLDLDELRTEIVTPKYIAGNDYPPQQQSEDEIEVLEELDSWI
jgi:hypothetical protein